MAIRERDVKDYFLKMLKTLPGKHIARKLSYENRIGAPDWMVIYNDIYLVELKKSDGKLSVGQEREIKRIEDAGSEVYVLMSYDDVDYFIDVLQNED